MLRRESQRESGLSLPLGLLCLAGAVGEDVKPGGGGERKEGR